MPLPNLVEIVPLDKPVRAEISVPGSKSITNRALVLAALADGETTLRGALWSEDTQVMVECLQELGFMVNVAPEPHESCNRTITVYGMGGRIPRGGTVTQPLELFVGNAGTAARFLTAMVCLGNGAYRIHGVPRMHERPQAALLSALRELGYAVDSTNDRLPAVIHGTGRKPGKKSQVSIQESSQFASALLLVSKAGGWTVEVIGDNAEESPYVAMTAELIQAFPRAGGNFRIELDASSGSYFLAAQWISSTSQAGDTTPALTAGAITIPNWPRTHWQIDSKFEQFAKLPSVVSRNTDLGDSIMTAIVIAPRGTAPVRFADLGRLRVQECERVAALRTELTRCGARVIETGDTLEVFPSQLHGAAIETYDDHRMAMCFAILGLKVAGIKIKNPACVKKTFPNFFQKLAAAPPHGLGVKILDASRQALSQDELFAD